MLIWFCSACIVWALHTSSLYVNDLYGLGRYSCLAPEYHLTLFPLQKFVIKEGIQFRIRIDFLVQREIVTGLKYIQKTSRMGVTGKPNLYLTLKGATSKVPTKKVLDLKQVLTAQCRSRARLRQRVLSPLLWKEWFG